MLEQSILWRRLDKRGCESASLSFQPPNWDLTGTALCADGRAISRIDYLVLCDRDWQTRFVRVTVWCEPEPREIFLCVDARQRWFVNGSEAPLVAGCIDLGLNFSPAPNTLLIHRLGLAIGEQASLRAAWLQCPSFKLEPLHQICRRVDAMTYRIDSPEIDFAALFTVNQAGVVSDYRQVSPTGPRAARRACGNQRRWRLSLWRELAAAAGSWGPHLTEAGLQ